MPPPVPAPLPPVAHNWKGEPLWEVESIIGERKKQYANVRRDEYLVHWVGCTSAEDSWELAAPLRKTAPDAVKAYRAAPKTYHADRCEMRRV